MKHFFIVGYKTKDIEGAVEKAKKSLNEAAKKQKIADEAEIELAKDKEEKSKSEKDLIAAEKTLKELKRTAAAAHNKAQSEAKNTLTEVCEVIDQGTDLKELKEKFNKMAAKESEFNLIRLLDDSNGLKQARPRSMAAHKKAVAEMAKKRQAQQDKQLKEKLSEEIKNKTNEIAEAKKKLKEIK